jgi:hypothetical protein
MVPWRVSHLVAMSVGILFLMRGAVHAQVSELDPRGVQVPAAASNRDGPSPEAPRAEGQTPAPSGPASEALPKEHPLTPVLSWAIGALPAIEGLKDYSATLVKRERVDGKLGGYEYLAIKVRHRPFSVYINFLGPATVRGQEVLYVEGQNNDDMRAHTGHSQVTVSLHPDSPMAMRNQHYPLTEIGIVNLVRRLVDVGQQDVRQGECEVKYFQKTNVNQRVCTMVQVVHPVPRQMFRFHLARIFVDDELRLPIRYESHDWPRQPDGLPPLIEEYTYLDLKVNIGLTDDDFTTTNRQYRFR